MTLHRLSTALLSTALLAALVACGDLATLPVAAGTGAQPILPPPQQRLIPTVHFAPAAPVPAPGLQVAAFARSLDHPRWLLALPNGDDVANTDAVLRFPYATGLRNPNGLAWRTPTGGGATVLWTVVNERDELGSNLVPDYLSAVQDGGFYGWPYSYHGRHVDPRVLSPRPDLVNIAIVPDDVGNVVWRVSAPH